MKTTITSTDGRTINVHYENSLQTAWRIGCQVAWYVGLILWVIDIFSPCKRPKNLSRRSWWAKADYYVLTVFYKYIWRFAILAPVFMSVLFIVLIILFGPDEAERMLHPILNPDFLSEGGGAGRAAAAEPTFWGVFWTGMRETLFW